MNRSDDNWWASVEATLAVGQRITGTSDELDQACGHIVRLLLDASVLLEAGSHASAVFVAITALEETAKIHIGIFRKSAEATPRRKDPLFQHKEKHHIAAAPTLAMGSRLQRVMGQQRMHELIELARSGKFTAIRESALYLEKCDGKLRVPSMVVTKSLARDLILLAIEAFDDAFVGYTDHSYQLGEVTDQIFEKWGKA